MFLAVGFSILYFVFDNQSTAYAAECACKEGGCIYDSLFDKIANDFKGASPFWLLMICLAFMVSNISRALRWNQLIEPLGYTPKTFNSFFATMVGYMINLALPRAGEIAKPAMLTKYEKTRVLGVRAKQINNGSAPFIELKENIIDGYLIAERELAEKKIPFIIRRPLPNRSSEYWRLEDLEII